MFLVLAAILLVTVLFLLTDRRYRWFYILYETLGRDIRAGWRFVKLSIKLYLYERNNQTVPKVFTRLAKQHPERIAFYFEDETWTYKRVEELSNRVAHFFKAEGYKRGDTVALLLESSPEYVCIWLGLSKIGVVTALVNNNLVSDPLMHSLKCSNASGFIFGANFSQVVKNVAGGLNGTKLYEWRDRSQKPQLENLGLDVKDRLEDQDSSSPHEEMEGGRTKDKILFIYTSGTTGLPKAAVITNTRFFFMAYALYTMMDIRQDDILYTPLPLYHSSGGLVGVGQSILCGIPVVIRKKFSASNFWKDCIKYRCTIAQYIGEICRYILAVHANDKEPPKHNVRLIVGNGLRPQIWNQFVTQFNVPQVGEFYGATEGNSNLINVDNKMGAVGFVPRYARQLYPVTLVKCNEATGEPIRNERGFCIPCQPGEPGVMIGNISSKRAANNFTGYADEKSTQSKVLKNVFSIGDLYFNSGDILVQDELGYYYFRDRTGDTFRWKGENVATSEVEAVISNLVDYRDAVVYGVQIPGTEGRAGMVAIVDTNNTLDLNKFYKGVKENLPSYSVPVFVRILQNGTALTGTYKLKKVELQKEGFNIDQIKDKVYFYDAKSSKYVELTEDIYNKIMSGEMRL